MSVSVYNLVGLRFHGIFYTGFISQCHQHLVSKGIVGRIVSIIGRVITIWDELLLKPRLSFDRLLSINEVLLGSIHRIETHIDVVVEFLEVYIRVAFGFCLNE